MSKWLFLLVLIGVQANCFAASSLSIVEMVKQCLPQEYQGIMHKIVKVESGGNPYAININNGPRLLRQPQNASEAIYWSEVLIKRGYSIDMGLGQINSQHLKANGTFGRRGYGLAQVFEPCANLLMSAYIFRDGYQRYGGDVLKALSAYNTGNPNTGLKNGYVAKYVSYDNNQLHWR